MLIALVVIPAHGRGEFSLSAEFTKAGLTVLTDCLARRWLSFANSARLTIHLTFTIEKRLARYPQLYSRVGFVHHYKPLGAEEARFILEHKWKQLSITIQADDFTDAEAVATVIRITGGNFRLIQRLCTQIERILQINALRTITKEVVEAARENLVVGP